MSPLVRFLQSKWTAAGIGTILFLATTAILLSRVFPEIARPHSSLKSLSVSTPSWAFQNPELDKLIAAVKDEKAALQQREQELNELARQVEAERSELNEVMVAVKQVRKEFDDFVFRVRKEEVVNLKKLAKVYAAMEPTEAALILWELQEDTLIKILLFMKEPQTAQLLGAFAKQGSAEAKRVAEVSERLRLAVVSKPVPPTL